MNYEPPPKFAPCDCKQYEESWILIRSPDKTGDDTATYKCETCGDTYTLDV